MAFRPACLNDLQRSVMKIRMVPVEQLFRRFPRMVRDVARQCGKEVELVRQWPGHRSRQEHSGCDRRTADAPGPQCRRPRHGDRRGARTRGQAGAQGRCAWTPITRAIRWSLKSPTTAAASTQQQIKAKAIDQRIADSRRSAPASAKPRRSNSSCGRDSARPKKSPKSPAAALAWTWCRACCTGSRERSRSKRIPDSGTTFRLRLPLTLAIIRALLFRVEQRLYAMPLNAVAEIARTSESKSTGGALRGAAAAQPGACRCCGWDESASRGGSRAAAKFSCWSSASASESSA